MQEIGTNAWSAQVPSDWVRNVEAPMPMYLSPQTQKAPIYLSVTDKQAGPGQGPPSLEAALDRLAQASNATVESTRPVKLGGGDGVAFRLAVVVRNQPAFFVASSSSVSAGTALSLLCGGVIPSTLEQDRETGTAQVKSVRRGR